MIDGVFVLPYLDLDALCVMSRWGIESCVYKQPNKGVNLSFVNSNLYSSAMNSPETGSAGPCGNTWVPTNAAANAVS